MTKPDFHRTSRRGFLAAAGVSAVALVLPSWRSRFRSRSVPGEVDIVEFTDGGERTRVSHVPKIVKSDDEWRKQLSPLAFAVARKGGTERSFSGAYWDLHDKGLFRCVCCGTALFGSSAKFDSGTGWPSFWQPIAEENVHHGAPSSGFLPSEVTCKRCDAHLGDLFDDGPKPTGLRYCIDSVSLQFVKSA